jgi:purine-binding chemotaxis protein CheW
MDVLVVDIGGQRYGLPALGVREVLRAVTITPLPSAPPVVEGVVAVRGEVLPVLDVRRRFRHPPRPLSAADHLVVARAGERLVVVRVDRALDLVSLDPGQVEEARRVVPEETRVAGIARLPDGLVLIHHLDAFLETQEGQALDAALAGLRAAVGRS